MFCLVFLAAYFALQGFPTGPLQGFFTGPTLLQMRHFWFYLPEVSGPGLFTRFFYLNLSRTLLRSNMFTINGFTFDMDLLFYLGYADYDWGWIGRNVSVPRWFSLHKNFTVIQKSFHLLFHNNVCISLNFLFNLVCVKMVGVTTDELFFLFCNLF